jgi:galactose mutarotase-like enzyme
MDHYPGGWQNVVPNAGGPATVHGAPLTQHGESALTPWDTYIENDGPQKIVVVLTTELTRYPLALERRFTLSAESTTLEIRDEMMNLGEVTVPYAWLQHIVFGAPMIGPETSVHVPCESIVADPDHTDPNARLEPGSTGSWPKISGADGEDVDLSSIPPKSKRIHDLAALTDLSGGEYKLINPSLDLSVSVSFPADLYEYVWYWGAFGGFETAPFFGRNYNLGLEPCTSAPNAGLDRAVEERTANQIHPEETVSASMSIATGPS